MFTLNDRSALLNNMLLLVPALLWGSSLTVRKMAEAYMTPLFFNSMRLYTAFIFVFCIQISLYIKGKKKNGGKESGLADIFKKTGSDKPLSYQIAVSVACGTVFGGASIFQQLGLFLTTASKTGFITTFYIILIPLISRLFLKTKVAKQVWAGAVIAILGLFLISGGSELRLSAGDIVVFICAIFFALQILLIAHCVKYMSVLFLNVVQFSTAATISLVFSFLFEQKNSLDSVVEAAGIILYAGVICIGVAYVLQSIAMKKASPSVAAIIISFEAVFGAIFAALFLYERMTGYQLLGCALIFAAIIIAQFENIASGR